MEQTHCPDSFFSITVPHPTEHTRRRKTTTAASRVVASWLTDVLLIPSGIKWIKEVENPLFSSLYWNDFSAQQWNKKKKHRCTTWPWTSIVLFDMIDHFACCLNGKIDFIESIFNIFLFFSHRDNASYFWGRYCRWPVLAISSVTGFFFLPASSFSHGQKECVRSV